MDKTWSLVVSVFWIAAALFLYALGAIVLLWLNLDEIFAVLFWLAGTVCGLIGVVKGIRLIY